ncbi:MAG: YfhO family protein, partial [Nitrospirae bacterium]|nr:YfhO family protein [Nitrospirota bacterium]
VLSSCPDIRITDSLTKGKVTLLKEGFNDILFEVTAPENTLLLLNDTFDNGWKASIDGNDAKIIRANYAFRAVAVPAGVHRVQFSFSAKGFKEGKVISLFSLSVFLCIVVFYFASRIPKIKAEKTLRV